MKPNTQQLNDLTIQVRRDILRMVLRKFRTPEDH
jgi:hypothetical protein